MAEIGFTDDAIDDLRRLGPEAVPKVLRKILMLLDKPEVGYPPGGELTGYRKLIIGRNTWRIVYRITEDESVEICEVWPRADAEVYAEATARVRAAGPSEPHTTKLAGVIERLGRLAGDVEVITEKSREPVPDWLTERLIYIVGMPRSEVAALDLQQAVDHWAAFISKPR